MLKRWIILGVMAFAIALGCARQGLGQASIALNFPIGCELGRNCFILQYPDRDPGPNAVDYGCGRMTYDGHKGTDFAISDESVMNQGVAVKASAAGKVLRVRDGVADRRIRTQADQDAVQGNECGNGVVIDHGNGWETQYCHLRQGSISVEPGQQVSNGDVLGLVGQSGLASFPHVHLTVRYQDQVVDPAVGVTSTSGCQVEQNPLWVQPPEYKPTGLVRSGVSSTVPNLDALWAGQFRGDRLSAQSPAVIFWVQMYGILAGDQEYFEIRNSQGDIVVSDTRTSDRSNRIALGYVGKKFTPGSLSPGLWTGRYQLTRDGVVIANESQSFQITPN